MAKLKIGQKAPDFSLLDTDGNKIKLSELRGKKVVLYFYPKDDTPGCIKEACSFRDELPNFDANNAAVFGISMDNQQSHKKFAEKYDLPFVLLCDTKGDVCKKYGIYGLKSLYGKKFWGIKRTTFIIDENRKIMHIFEKVNPENHAKEVLEAIR